MTRRVPTLEEQLAVARRDRRRVARERLIRAVAGDRWRRMTRLVPVLFAREGVLVVRTLILPWDEVVAGLRVERAVFAHDTAMRVAQGHGFLKGGDVFAYVSGASVVDRLAARGLVSPEPHHDAALVRPWPGPPRLLACIVAETPPHRALEDGSRVVEGDRLRAELVGVVGLRADLFALAE